MRMAVTVAKLFADDFEGVCRGATVSRATAYSASAPSHEVILFSPNGSDVVEDTTDLPADWMVEFDDDTQRKTYDAPPAEDDLVAFLKPFVKP